MSTIKEIKNQLTDDTIYPVTKANAVYMANGSKTVETVINNDLVHTAGDSMTGVLQTVRRIDSIDQNIEDSYTPATSSYYGDSETGAGFYIRDNNKESMGFLAPVYTLNGGAGVQFGAHRQVNNNNVYNSIWLTVKDDGSGYVSIDKDAWHNALELTGSNPLFKVKNYSISNGSMTAGSTKVHTAADLGKTNPTGYTPISYYYLTTGNNSINAYVINIGATGSANLVYLKNLGSTTISASTFSISIVYAKTDFKTNA